jgi:hypothetical protein
MRVALEAIGDLKRKLRNPGALGVAFGTGFTKMSGNDAPELAASANERKRLYGCDA